jgi:RNA polymerase sigma factor (sigma-70 family)
MLNDSNGRLATQPERLSNPLDLYERLKNLDHVAIDFLHQKVQGHLFYKRHLTRATEMDLEELASDAVVLMLSKIEDGSYTFQGPSPVSYALMIAQNLLRNFCRKKRVNCLELNDAIVPFQQPEVEAYLAQNDLKNQVELALGRLSEPCQLVIRLKYFDDMRDEEIVRDGLSPHRSTDSLKSSRCRSLKRLAGLMRE